MSRKALNWLLPTLLLVSGLATASAVEARQSNRIARIGYLSAGGPQSLQVLSFRHGLRELGYIEGKNLSVEYRYLEGHVDRIPGIVRELLQLKVDIFVSTNYPAIREANQITKTTPIVMVTTQDPVASGLVNSLARPGGNVTGLTRLTRELAGKRLELIIEVVPGLSSVGILWDVNARGPILGFKDYRMAATALNIKIRSLEVRGPDPKFSHAFQAVRGRVDTIVPILNPTFNRHQKRIADLAQGYRIPSMCERSDYVEAGCLLSYSADERESYRRAAWYVDRILKGTKPANLPVEQPTKFEFAINLRTAQQIGLTIPPNVLVRADRVIR